MNETGNHPQLATLHLFFGRLTSAARLGLLVLLVVNLCLMVHYIAYGYQAYLHSDAAAKSLLAQEIYETGKYFPREWNYVNADLMLVFGHLFILPLLPFFDNGYALHAASGMFSACLILLGTWLVSGVASRSPWARLLCTVIVASGISEIVAENLFGQVSYGNVFFMACFTLYFAWRSIVSDGRARWGWGTLLAISIMLLFWANPQRAIASYGLPLILAIVVYTSVSLVRAGLRWNALASRGVAALALLVLGAVIGSGLHGWVLANVNNSPGAGAARWLPFDGMVSNFVDTVQGLLSLLGAAPVSSGDVVSWRGLNEAVRLLAMGSLLVLIPVALVKAWRDGNDGMRFVAVFAVVSMAVFLFLHITTTIPDMRDPVTSARYLVPPLLFALLIVTITVVQSASGIVYRIVGGAVLVILATSAFSATHPFSRAFDAPPQDHKQELIKLLESSGLHYGYGTFWNAGVLTILSEQRVRVRQVALEHGLPIPMRHLSSDRWYRPDAWRGETFLLLSDSEAKSVKWDLLETYIGKPRRVLRSRDFNIYVFPQNMAGVLPSWSDDLTSPLSLRLSESSSHQIGSFDATGGPGALVAEQGQGGYLHFGPYLKLKPGTYQATFDVETVGSVPTAFGAVDVTSNGSASTHASHPLSQLGRHQVRLRFKLDHSVNDMEVRVFSSGVGRMKLHRIELAPAE